jgi:polysaccharide deacetylase 2 family uncharacterized protein YibQ
MSRKKKRTKRQRASFYASFLAFSGAGALFLGTALYLAFLSEKPSSLPFEERSSPLSRQITRIDHAIFTCLYKAKIPQTNILFQEVQSRQRDGAEWDITALLVHLPRQALVSRLEKDLNRVVSSTSGSVRFRSEKGPLGEAVVHIYAGTYLTHCITMRPYEAAIEEATKRQIPSPANKGKARSTARGGRAETSCLGDGRVRAGREGSVPRVAIILDDLGYDEDLAKCFMDLEVALTLSILPMAPFTETIVEAARERKREIMLHLPMEPEHHPRVDAGPGALLTNMSHREIRRILEEDLKRVPGARGVNNHMGSRFTQSEDGMDRLLNELRHRGLFYVDSRTTSRTVALEVARRQGVAAARRDVFLDNDLTQGAMAFQLQRLLAMSRQAGKAIGIAHPHPETLAFLRQSAPLLKREASVVHVSEMVE